MKPDKHKRRKNAAYAAKKNQKSKEKPLSQSHDRNQVENMPPHVAVPDTGIESKSPVVHEEVGNAFSRRKIESNWARYEDFPDESEEKVEKRGEDFNFLLSQTVTSGFRFKDEEFEDEEIEENINEVLSLDCLSLAERLKSIPLPERLGIPRTDFDPELLALLDQDAGIAVSTGAKSKPEISANLPYHSHEVENLTKDLESVLSRSQVTCATMNTQSKKYSNHEDNDFDKKSNRSQTKADTRTSHSLGEPNIKESKNCSMNSAQESKISQEEEDLDFLLSLDASSETNSKPSYKSSIESKPDIIEENTSPTELNEKEDGKLQKDNSVSSTTKPTTTESLDDWLDSILDD